MLQPLTLDQSGFVTVCHKSQKFRRRKWVQVHFLSETHEMHVKSAQQNEKPCCGVKRKCAFSAHLSHFDVCTGYPADIAWSMSPFWNFLTSGRTRVAVLMLSQGHSHWRKILEEMLLKIGVFCSCFHLWSEIWCPQMSQSGRSSWIWKTLSMHCFPWSQDLWT